MLPMMAASALSSAAGGSSDTSGDIRATGPTINIGGPAMKTQTVALIVLAAVVVLAVLMKKGR